MCARARVRLLVCDSGGRLGWVTQISDSDKGRGWRVQVLQRRMEEVGLDPKVHIVYIIVHII